MAPTTLRAHYLSELDDHLLSHLQSLCHKQVRVTAGKTLPDDVQILISGKVSKEELDQCPNLTHVIVPWAGLPQNVKEALEGRPEISVHNTHHNALQVAECALGLLLAAAKHMVPYDQSLRQHNWEMRYKPNPSLLLHGKNALILGYGAIGQALAPMLKGLGLNIAGIKANPKEVGGANPIPLFGLSDLEAQLKLADVLMICLPLTHETRGLIGKDELSALGAQGVLVNIGRGAIVDDSALYHALKDRVIHSAGFDVWWTYPKEEKDRTHTPPSDFPFHELDNMVFSPHRAGTLAGKVHEEGRMQALADLLHAVVEGKEVPNRVDLEKGY